jgi:hypothetical protein
MKLFAVSEPVDSGVIPTGIVIDTSLEKEGKVIIPAGMRWGSNTEGRQIIPLARPQYKIMKAAVEAGIIQDGPCVLGRADLREKRGGENGETVLLFEVEKDPSDQRALVYLSTSTAPAQKGSQRGRLPDDAVPDAVVLTADDFRRTEAVGVTVIAEEEIQQNGARWKEMVLLLLPGASFRVVRGGDMREKIPEFSVRWNGYKLRTVIPERYRSRSEEVTA